MRTILVATDFSETSASALKFANMLRQQLSAQLFVVHVFDMKPTFMSTVSIAYTRLEEAAFVEYVPTYPNSAQNIWGRNLTLWDCPLLYLRTVSLQLVFSKTQKRSMPILSLLAPKEVHF